MEFISDLHLHSKYSRATSPRNDIKTLNEWARIKGINIIGTGDFSHPKWLQEIKRQLVPSEKHEGLYKLKSNNQTITTNFILTNELSTIYYENGKTRKIHHCVLAQNIEIVEQINDIIGKKSDLKSDGRPIINLTSPELVDELIRIDKWIEIFPAHIWTPWFGVLGSKSGFDSIDECYKDQKKHIHAFETGLSSDPAMNWRLSNLDKYTILSNSDAHSPENLGREATVFDFEPDKLNYKNIIKAIRKKNIVKTIEFYPEEGKYFCDGHRKCKVCLKPKESLKYNNICPVCHKKLTLGVAHRVEELSDRAEGEIPNGRIPFAKLIPLRDIISQVVGSNKNSKKVMAEYLMLIKYFGNEYRTLHAGYDELKLATDKKVAQAITDAREGKIIIFPGYDGVYGKVVIGNKTDKRKSSKDLIPQKTINEFL